MPQDEAPPRFSLLTIVDDPFSVRDAKKEMMVGPLYFDATGSIRVTPLWAPSCMCREVARAFSISLKLQFPLDRLERGSLRRGSRNASVLRHLRPGVGRCMRVVQPFEALAVSPHVNRSWRIDSRKHCDRAIWYFG